MSKLTDYATLNASHTYISHTAPLLMCLHTLSNKHVKFQIGTEVITSCSFCSVLDRVLQQYQNFSKTKICLF